MGQRSKCCNGFENDGCRDAVQDKVCISFEAKFSEVVSSQVIYSANLPITATGYISNIELSANITSVSVGFSLGTVPIHTITSLTDGESIAFTVQNFDQITIFLETPPQLPILQVGTARGELSLTPRYS